MGKKPSLTAALHEASKKPVLPVALAEKPSNSTQSIQPGRVGKKPISGFFDPAVSRQLKQLALDQNSTVQDLLGEALNDLFEKHHLKPIA